MGLLLSSDLASLVIDGVNLLTNLLELMVKICGPEQGESNYSTEEIITALCILDHGKKDCGVFSVACQADVKALVFCLSSSFSGHTGWSQTVCIFSPFIFKRPHT